MVIQDTDNKFKKERRPMSDSPLLTNSFLEYFVSDKLKDKILIEIGAGDSTVFWGKHFNKVISYESDVRYFDFLKEKINKDNTELNLFDKNIFEDSKFLSNIKIADYIIIDNPPMYIDRYYFCKYAKENKKESCSIILDNGTWNMEAYEYLRYYFFCLDFPGVNKANELTVTSMFNTEREIYNEPRIQKKDDKS
jgi:hypothetical protein